MPSSPEKSDDEFLTFGDLWKISKKNRRTIYFGAIVCAILGLFYGLTKPIEYLAEATFREKSKSSSGMHQSISHFFFSSDASDSDALSMMKSRKLMEQLVAAKGLQAFIVKKEFTFPYLPLQTIKNNLLIEYALFQNWRFPILDGAANDLFANQVLYTQETPLTVDLQVLSDNEYELFENKQKIGSGHFGEPFFAEKFSLIISRNTKKPIALSDYSLTFFPLGIIAEATQRRFFIEADKNDKGIIKISYKSPNRQQAAEHVNMLMSLYQDHLQDEHQRLCNLQVDYLQERQKEMGKQLVDIIRTHANELSSDLSTTGFATSQKAMDFLAASQQELSRKLFTIDLETQRLENIETQFSPDYDKFISMHDSEVFRKLASDTRSLRQQADSLSMALRNISSNAQDFQNSFSSQLAELEKIKKSAKEANLMFTSLQKDELPEPFPTLIDNPKLIVKAWHARLALCQTHLEGKQEVKSDEWQQCKEGFTSYLSHLIHFFQVHQRNLEAHLSHQQAPITEFQGINLATAKDLYITYSKDLSSVEAQAIQQKFIIEHISNPDFEISSLSTILSDSVSTEMISKASNILLSLKDSDNRSLKEQERLKADLVIQKGFLTSHLQQAGELLELRQKFLKAKILQLQSVTLSLVQEEMSIIENQIKKYISGTLESLRQEKQLLEDNLADLRVEMAAFPQKWASEQLVEQQMEINKSMVEEISKLVESKNISNNLENIQSAPIDLPLVPLHPRSPRLLLLMIVGAIGGAFLGFTWIMVRSASRGIEASADNLRLIGQHISGPISREYTKTSDRDPVLDSDLDTMRRLLAYMSDNNHDKGNTLLILKNQGPNYAIPLAELTARKGLKVLVLNLCFDGRQEEENSGLLQYLEGKTGTPEVIHEALFDRIASGGICRYANELITSQHFNSLLQSLRQQYDWIFIISNAPPQGAEAETLLEVFPYAAVSLSGELLQQLRHCLRYADKPNSRLSFIFTPET